MEHIRSIKAMESHGVAGAIIGKALYEGKISVAQALKRLMESDVIVKCWRRELFPV